MTLQGGSGGSYGSILLAPSGGNVGIGTTSPAAALDVNGTISAGGQLTLKHAYLESTAVLASGNQTLSSFTTNIFTLAIVSASNVTLPDPTTLPTNTAWNVTFIVTNSSGSIQSFTTTAGGSSTLLWDSNSSPLVPVGVSTGKSMVFNCTLVQAANLTYCGTMVQ